MASQGNPHDVTLPHKFEIWRYLSQKRKYTVFCIVWWLHWLSRQSSTTVGELWKKLPQNHYSDFLGPEKGVNRPLALVCYHASFSDEKSNPEKIIALTLQLLVFCKVPEPCSNILTLWPMLSKTYRPGAMFYSQLSMEQLDRARTSSLRLDRHDWLGAGRQVEVAGRRIAQRPLDQLGCWTTWETVILRGLRNGAGWLLGRWTMQRISEDLLVLVRTENPLFCQLMPSSRKTKPFGLKPHRLVATLDLKHEASLWWAVASSKLTSVAV